MRRHLRSRAVRVLPALLLLPVVLVFCRPVTPAGESTDDGEIARGRSIYGVYCVNCHGESAKGDGPTARILLVKPTDLTRLSERNGGVFPFDRVYRTIDGRELVQGHGARQMPIWGIALQQWDQDSDQRDEVGSRILRLTHYLRSIQQPQD